MLADLLLGSLVRSALSARSKPHLHASGFLGGGASPIVNLGTLVGAAGLAWGAYETFKHRGPATTTTVPGGLGAQGPGSTPGTVTLPPPIPQTGSPAAPPPIPSGGPEETGEALRRIVALTIAAARADGELGEEEYGRILQSAREHGADELVRGELSTPRPLAQIVSGVVDPRLKNDLYVLAFGIVRADVDVTQPERAWLKELARLLGLDAATVARLEAETVRRIEQA